MYTVQKLEKQSCEENLCVVWEIEINDLSFVEDHVAYSYMSVCSIISASVSEEEGQLNVLLMHRSHQDRL